MMMCPTLMVVSTLNPAMRSAVPLLALLISGTWVLAMLHVRGLLGLPIVLGGPAAPAFPTRFAVTSAVLATGFLVAGTLVSLRMRRASQDALQQVSQAREETLALYADQRQVLASVLGELAHEVKNPMASIKGLAALMAKDQSGKNAERMEVLRGEVDRMQAAVEDLLNFSRPLSPLSQKQVDLGGICASVARLHEGMLSAKSLKVAVPPEGGALARCDPRKVKQVMVNLLQNAIDASPPGETIEIQITPRDAGQLAVSVLDRGKGLDPHVAAHLFQPGTTTKPRGSGLGLTIARTMALQQGGELAVASREGGGCSATLVLPREGVESPLAA
jgi:signal transduction histidine kinase